MGCLQDGIETHLRLLDEFGAVNWLRCQSVSVSIILLWEGQLILQLLGRRRMTLFFTHLHMKYIIWMKPKE